MAFKMCKIAKVDASLFQSRGPTERLVGTRDFDSAGPYVQYLAYKPLEEHRVNEVYTKEEIQDFDSMLEKSRGTKLYSDGRMYLRDMSERAIMLLSKPLESMPLYVNDEDIEAQVVAIWRLKWAK